MFTCVITIPVDSHLGRLLPFLQHLTTVAVVHSIRTLPGLEVSRGCWLWVPAWLCS